MKEALIAFVRGFVGAGVATAILFVTTNLEAAGDQKFFVGVILAFLTGAINFIGAFLREQTTPSAVRGAREYGPKSTFSWLPF